MFLASARLAPTAPLGAPQQQQPPSAWSLFGRNTSPTWGTSSVFCFPFTMPTPSPPAQPPAQPPATTAAATAPNPPFNFNFNATDDASNPFAISAPASAAEPTLPAIPPARRRESKFAPLLRRKDPEAERRKRRDAYMTEVRERRDAALWETRGESSLQRDFLDEQRAWEQEQAREAEAWMPDPNQFEEEDFPQHEDHAMEEIVPEMDEDLDWAAAWDDSRSRSSFLVDSDDEYERLMLEIAAEAESMQTHQDTVAEAQAMAQPETTQQSQSMVSSAPLSSPSHGMDMSLG